MKQSHRLLAVILAVVMLVGILPLGIFAADAQPSGQTPVVVIAGSDFQDPSGTTASIGNVSAILTQIKKAHPTADSLIFCGDYGYDMLSGNNSVAPRTTALKAAVNSVFPQLDDFFLVQGNHDQVTQGSQGLTGPGAHDTADYGVFLIDEDDYQWASSGIDPDRIQKTAANLNTYLEAKAAANYAKPIFVASHVPLHYSARTQRDGDAKYAKYIFDVLQAGAEAGLNIIFLYGHDHSNGWDNYLGGAAVYLPVGYDIHIADLGSQTNCTTYQLGFTYLNAGFTGYYTDGESESGVDKSLTMTVFEITDSQVKIERYDANGIHALKSVGKPNNKYTDPAKCAPTTDSYASPQVLTLNDALAPATENVTDRETGISFKLPVGSSTPVVAEADLNGKTFKGIAKYKAYDITVKDFSGTAEVSIPVPAGYDASRVAVYYVLNGNIVENMKATVKNGKAVFQTTHFSTYMIAENESVTVNTWTKIEIPGTATYTYTLDTNGIDNNGEYLIAAPSGTDRLLINNNESAEDVTFTLSGNQVILNTDAYDWTVSPLSGYSYEGQSVSLSFRSNTTLYLDNPTNYYVLVDDNYYQVTSASCTRSGQQGWNRTYSWTINYADGSVTYSTASVTLYTRTAQSGYTFKNGSFYITGSTSNSIRLGNTAYDWEIIEQNVSNGVYRIRRDGEYYIRYYNGWAHSNYTNSSYYQYRNLRLFKLIDTQITPADIYYLGTDAENQTFTVGRFANKTELETYLQEIIHVLRCEDDTTPTASSSVTEIEYTLSTTDTVNPAAADSTVNYSVMVGDTTVGTFTVTFTERVVDQAVLNYYTGEVTRGAKNTAKTGATISVYYEDGGAPDVIDVTVGMLSGTGLDVQTVGVYENLTVTYNGMDLTDENNKFTLTVNPKPGENDYPEYPNQGAVRVNKTGQGVDWLSTGVARIELSATGVPMQRGVDVIVMLDTSSSMNDAIGNTTRIAVLRQSMKNMLKTFSQPDATTGVVPDINIAIADFNGYTSSGAYALDSGDHLTGCTTRSGGDSAQVYTGSNRLDKDAFVKASSFGNETTRNSFVNGIRIGSGTNYDAAFYKVYQLGKAITEANEAAGEDRDLYVVFMSDGAPFQYNGFSSQSQPGILWNNWLQGTANNAARGSHAYFYNGAGNKHRWAEAIKGSTAETFTVIDKTKNTTGSNAYLTEVNGLGATMYSIGFCLAVDKDVTVASMEYVLKGIATNDTYYHKVDTAAELDNAFTQIAANIKKAGYNASFVDKMGAAYDLKLTPFTLADKTTTFYPTIQVSTYELYKLNEVGTTVNGVTVTQAMVGTRKSSTPIVQETVTFNPVGTAAYSDKLEAGVNILTNNKINAKLFTYDLTTETFTWNLGDITEDEQVLTYYVYLTGSMEGTRPAGSYPTNEDATLHYMNWLDHDCELPTVSPVLSWASATVGFAYYLVNDDGNIIANRTTGQIGSFATRVTVADPVIEQILLNNLAGFTSTSGSTYLPFGYELYDSSAAFAIDIRSGENTSYWNITTGDGKTPTTYVTGYNGNEFTTFDSSDLTGNVDYTHTTVWFAVRCTLGCIPDIVVVDYGRPVDISVLVNDMFGEYGTLAGIGAAMPAGIDSKTKMDALAEGFGKNALTLSYGSASVIGSKVTFSFPEKNMNMTDAVTFAYAAKYENPEDNANDGYYYATVTVVPAATLYFEDDFVEYEGDWTTVGNALTSKQSEDRPGKIPMVDANNVYGYDGAYSDCITYSFGAAKKLTVSSANANLNGESYARFTFTGTAFDIISVTSKDTGTIVVLVEDSNGNKVAEYVVNTFYGYVAGDTVYHKYTWIHRDGAWYLKGNRVETATEDQYTAGDKALPTANIEDGKEYVVYDKMVEHSVTTDANNALYQIPVIKSEDFEYGTYTVTITPKYSALQDACHDGEYDFYLDAIRVYNPAGNDEEINNIYYQDNEGKPTYFEVRNNLIGETNAFTIGDDRASGVVFIDKYGDIEIDSLPEYTFYGPNNEVYLNKGEGIAFAFDATDPTAIAAIHIGLKAVNSAVTVSINGKNVTLNTSTDMYYDLTAEVNFPDGQTTSQPVVILANGDGMLSVTNIKVTSKKATEAANNGVALTMDRDALALALDQIAIGHKPVATTVYGDFNVDGEINSRDLALLRKYFAGYDYTTGTSSFAIEGWNPTVRDLAKLRKYLSAYDYETGSSAYVLVPDEQ